MNRSFTETLDLESLVQNGAVENLQLEFKRYEAIDGKLIAKDKDTLAKEIVAMSNAEGGHIIIGIDEDGNRCASKLTDAGLTQKEFDGFQLSIQQYLLAKVRPRIYGINYKSIPIFDDKIAVVVYVPKSYNRPHALNDGNKDVFYIRHSNGVTNMSVDDLRRQFLLTSSIKSDIREFRRDRIASIMSDEGPLELKAGARLLMHIIPLWSLEAGNSIDLSQISNKLRPDAWPLFAQSCNYNYNSEGFLTYYKEYLGNGLYGKTNSFIQFFRNGIIELAESRVMNYNTKLIYNWQDVERRIYKKLRECLNILSALGVPVPIYIYISIIGAKGFYSNSEYCECAIDKDIVNAVECIYDGEEDLSVALHPTFDSLANAFGAERSFNYNKNGIYMEN